MTGVCGSVFLDYYIVTINRAAGPLTLVCDLNRRQWFRFSNVPASCYIVSGGSGGTERVWAGFTTANRLANISPCFFPVIGPSTMADADSTPVLPVFETPWYKLANEGRKRSRFVYLSYDLRLAPIAALDDVPASWRRNIGEEGSLTLAPRAAAVDALDVAFIRSPQMTDYTSVGQLPSTDSYRRYRLPVGQSSYGIAFKVAQITAASVLRIFDLSIDAHPLERSRI